MNTAAKHLTRIAAVVLAISLLFQGLAIWSVLTKNAQIAEEAWFLPCWIGGLALLVVAVILTAVLWRKNAALIAALALAAAGTVLVLIVSLSIKAEFITSMDLDGHVQGITVFKLIYRHLSSCIAGVILIIAAGVQLAENIAVRKYKDMGEGTHYDLRGKPIFKDESTLGLDHFGGEEAAPRKLKRSMRAAQKAAEDAENAQ